MENLNFSRWQNQVLTLACTALLFSCSHLEPFSLESDDVLKVSTTTGPSVPPIFWNTGPGGNVTCSEVGDYEYTSGRIDYNGSFSETFPDGFTITVTGGKYVTWSFADPNGIKCLDGISIIVKGGNAANVYTYGSGVSGDSFLISPTNRGGNTPDLSNLTLCYNLKDCEDEPCYDWKDETAWAAISARANRYNRNGGNWATWIKTLDVLRLPNSTVNIYAGQTIFVGTATFNQDPNIAGNYQINLSLNSGVRLKDSSENVKIQGYLEAPTGNPSPGQFAHKFDARTEIISIPKADFYGFHLDVEIGREIECPEE